MRRLACAVLVTLAATPAPALSCKPFGVTDAFLEAEHSRSAYVVVTGRLDFDKKRLPKVDKSNQVAPPRQTLIPARIEGRSLGRAGFVREFTEAITLEVLCYGPWCASATSGGQYLAFLERRDKGYVLSVNPCGGMGFAAPTKAMIRQVTDCLNGRGCRPSDF